MYMIYIHACMHWLVMYTNIQAHMVVVINIHVQMYIMYV